MKDKEIRKNGKILLKNIKNYLKQMKKYGLKN